MKKYFCDRCGKEAEKLINIPLPDEKTNDTGFSSKLICVCKDCENEFDKILSKLIDIRFILFNDFMEQ